MLTPQQWKLFKAIAYEQKVYYPSARKFLQKHDIGNPASIIRALHSLFGSELIYKETDCNGDSYYMVYDILFSNWVRDKNQYPV